MTPVSGNTAIVTGASSGIGRAIALRLARAGVRVALVGRDRERLEAARQQAGEHASVFPCDLGNEVDIRALAKRVTTAWQRVDILVHSAGVIALSRLEDERALADLDLQYAINLRGPYLLTHLLLPQLKASQGQVVFVSSSITRAANIAGRGQYAAIEHASKAIADSLRDEVNSAGVRVMSLYPGTTATPLQERLHAETGRDFEPERMLKPEDVAELALTALELDRTAETTDLYMRPMQPLRPMRP